MTRNDAGIFIMRTLILTILIVATAFTDCKNSQPSMPEIVKAAARAPVGMVPVSDAVIERTTKGVTIRGAKSLSQYQKDLIDIGFDKVVSSAAEDGFTKEAYKTHDFNHVSIPPYSCIPSPVSRTPSFVVSGGAEYDGTIYDQYNTKGQGKKDGISVVFASEMVFSIGTPGSIPEHGWLYVCPDESVLANAVQHGGEHIYLANFPYTEKWRIREPYDGYAWFNATVFHGPGHPLLPRHAGQIVNNIANDKQPTSNVETLSVSNIDGQEVLLVKGSILRVVR